MSDRSDLPSEEKREPRADEPADHQGGIAFDELLPAVRPLGGPEAPVSGETEPIVLSRGNLFCVLNRRGDIAPAGARDLGLFHEDTRHLSRLELVIAGGPATVLSAETSGSSSSQIDLTLTDRLFGGFFEDPRNFLHVRRRQLLDEVFVERVTLTNHLRRAIDLSLSLAFEVDFADIFEVRGAGGW
jgi:glycogen debranching enzyme